MVLVCGLSGLMFGVRCDVDKVEMEMVNGRMRPRVSPRFLLKLGLQISPPQYICKDILHKHLAELTSYD